jgi:hypothetical protein
MLAEQIARGAPVVPIGGLAAEIVPFLDATVAAPEPHQRHQIDLLIFGHGVDEAFDLAHHGILAIILQHIDHVVIGAVRPGVRIGSAFLDVEFTGFLDQKRHFFGRNG